MVPLLFATDKTQLTNWGGETKAYPLYMSIGNIDKSTRRKPSHHAWTLVAYLPIDTLEDADLTDLEGRVGRQRLFHECMRKIVYPLIAAGKEGLDLTGGDGAIRRCYPILAIYAADYPEQCLVTCSRYGQVCPICGATVDEFGAHVCLEPRDSQDTLKHLRHASRHGSLGKAYAYLTPFGLNPVDNPFWEDLPHCNIHASITPDILHQGYQGLLKHLISWLRRIVGTAELDARFERLPPMSGTRLFSAGISVLTRVSGKEHKEICKQILGCVIGKVPARVVRATSALLDFFYIAQYQSHTDDTLGYLEDALDRFHKDKDAFLTCGGREGELSCIHVLHPLLIPFSRG